MPVVASKNRFIRKLNLKLIAGCHSTRICFMLVDVSSEFMLYLVSDVRYRITHVGFGFARVRNKTIRLVIPLRALMCKREFKDTPCV